MTLNSRNNFFLIAFIGMAVQTAAILLYGVIIFLTGRLAPIPTDLPQSSTILGLLFNKTYYAGCLNILLLALYATSTGFILLSRFEKTIAPEIMYFAAFLAGVFLETYRLAIPLFDLWGGFRPLLTAIGKAAYAGRLLTMFTLLYTSFPVSEGFVQDTDRNIGLCLCVSVLFASLVPLNTHTILPSVMIPFSFGNLFLTIHILLFFTSIVTIVFTNRFPRFLGLLVAYGGYLILTVSASFFFTLLGSVTLVTGTIIFLVKLHAFYLWK